MNSDAFLIEVTNIEQGIKKLGSAISNFERIHKRAVVAVNSQDESVLNAELDRHVYETNKLVNAIRNRIKSIERGNKASLPDHQLRNTQIKALSRSFINQLTRYQQAQVMHQKAQKHRVERQYRIVNPNASREEIERAVSGNNRGPVFQQGMIGGRSMEARRILEEVESRHEQIVRLAQSIEQLQQLFLDMQTMVEEQDQRIDMVVSNVDESKANLEAATKQMTLAVKSKRLANKKRCYLILFIIILLIIIALVLMFTVFKEYIFVPPQR